MVTMPVRVLVVDDDAVSREVFALLLNGAGYAVEMADSGDAALLHLQTTRPAPEVILTDLQMPGISGGELARQLRNLCGSTTRLLVMSASVPEDGAEREFDGFLRKPFTMETFAAAISGAKSGAAKASNGKTDGVLDERVYRKLAGSMRPSQLVQLYAMCLADAEGRLAGMRRAAADGDDLTYKREAHAIKGGCGMVGALELQTLATSMEEHGLRDDHVASLEEFLVACERLRGMLVAIQS
jgi:CheY-like chemotaxis protein/HPt (histidine-containing phosphotransfer) domain-containing protein